MSFFIKKKGRISGLKQKPSVGTRGKKSNLSFSTNEQKSKSKKFSRGSEGEEIPSDSDLGSDDESQQKRKFDDISSSEEEETAQDKRIRLAKHYLSKLETEETEKGEDGDTTDAIAHRLKQDILEQSGKLHKYVASRYTAGSQTDIKVMQGHKLPVTCLVISADDQFIFSGSKDCSIIKWCMKSAKKIKIIAGGRKGTEDKHKGHTAHVLSLAISTDNKFLASGDRNKLIFVWNPDTCELLHKLTGHRDAVSGLAFRRGTHQLFSASHDRTVKIWNVDEMAYVETLFGHHDVLTGIDSMTRERAVTAGGRDGSVRVWKVIEESQLIFHGHAGSIDCVALINEEHFISGADDNSLAVWSVLKKKPVVTVTNAHHGAESKSPQTKTSENWISSVTSLCHTDLIASGSKDGYIRLWQCSQNFKSLIPILSLPMPGFVNSLKFSSDGMMLVAGIGQEHRLGRWWRLKDAKNSVCIIPLEKKPDEKINK